MNLSNICYRCFFEKPIADKPCPKCGYKHTPEAQAPNCLLPGTMLKNRYLVGIALGVGGFGITYKCLDTQIGGICAIKEYFPANFAMRAGATKFVSVPAQNVERYNKVMKRFVEESRLLRKLQHPNVISTYDSFFENNTAYYVMEYCDGIDLRRHTNNFTKKLGYAEGINLLYQIMNGLEYVHSLGILHRDISPDNIYVTKGNTVKILDFGSARSELDQYNRELSVIIKVGYAPIEQYGGRGKQGPYTDIYALGATFYHLFSTKMPMESTQRVAEDTLVPFSQLRPDLPDNLKYAIEKAMALSVTKRIASIAEMKQILGLANVSKRPQNPEQKIEQEYPRSKLLTMWENTTTSIKETVLPAIKPKITPTPKPPKQPKPPKTPKAQKRPVYRARGYYVNPNIASIPMRAAAYLIDLCLWSSVYFGILLGALELTDYASAVIGMFPIVFTVINIISELLVATTVGKALLRMRVCGTRGEPIRADQVILRNIIKLLLIFVVFFAEGNALLEDRVTESKVSC